MVNSRAWRFRESGFKYHRKTLTFCQDYQSTLNFDDGQEEDRGKGVGGQERPSIMAGPRNKSRLSNKLAGVVLESPQEVLPATQLKVTLLQGVKMRLFLVTVQNCNCSNRYDNAENIFF